jgi:hypothetical protein
MNETPDRDPQPCKKPWSKPVLHEYGTIQALTGNSGNSMFARGDGGPPSSDKTH